MRHSFALGFAACLALIVGAQAASAAACALTAGDLAALRASRAALASQAQIDALPQDRQTALCATRLHWNRIAAGEGAENEWHEVTPDYLSPRERRAYGRISDRAVRRLNKRPDGEWGPISKETLDALKK
jgi:hypothetical protein